MLLRTPMVRHCAENVRTGETIRPSVLQPDYSPLISPILKQGIVGPDPAKYLEPDRKSREHKATRAGNRQSGIGIVRNAYRTRPDLDWQQDDSAVVPCGDECGMRTNSGRTGTKDCCPDVYLRRGERGIAGTEYAKRYRSPSM